MLMKFYEFVNNERSIEARLEEINDLLSNYTNDKLSYTWESDKSDEMVINFEYGGIPFRYEVSSNMILVVYENNTLKHEVECKTLDEVVDYIEKDIYFIVGLDENKLII